MGRLVGLFGRPFVDLEPLIAPLIDDAGFAAIDREVTRGLAELDVVGQTGGSLKHMGIVAPWVVDDGYRDYGHVIDDFDFAQWQELVSLADDPAIFADAASNGSWRDVRFGDETEHPLNARQIRFLTYAHGVYFPWKVSVHLLENVLWQDKHSGRGKRFTDDAEQLFPTTTALIRSLPFSEIGRVVIFGLLPNDHAPAHRDSEPGKDLTIAQSMSLCPRGDKRFYVTDPDHDDEVVVDTRAYWFNDMDYHGVRADPFFRYSIRIDGVYRSSFLKDIERHARRRSGAATASVAAIERLRQFPSQAQSSSSSSSSSTTTVATLSEAGSVKPLSRRV